MPGEGPAGAENATCGGGVALHPQRPATGTPRGEDAEKGPPRGKTASLTARKGNHQVERYVEELESLQWEAHGCAPP